jgi:hypothetical protein
MKKRKENLIILIFKTIYSFFTWLLLRLFFIDLTFKELENRRYDNYREEIKHEINSNDVDLLAAILNELRLAYERVSDRKQTIDRKIKSLLTITTILIPLITAFLAPWPISLVGIAAIVFSLISIIFSMIYLGINKSTEPLIETNHSEASMLSVQLALIKDYRVSNSNNKGVVDFLADMYKAARRAFLVALLFLVANVILGISNFDFNLNISQTRQSNPASFRDILVIKNSKKWIIGVGSFKENTKNAYKYSNDLIKHFKRLGYSCSINKIRHNNDSYLRVVLDKRFNNKKEAEQTVSFLKKDKIRAWTLEKTE